MFHLRTVASDAFLSRRSFAEKAFHFAFPSLCFLLQKSNHRIFMREQSGNNLLPSCPSRTTSRSFSVAASSAHHTMQLEVVGYAEIPDSAAAVVEEPSDLNINMQS